MSWRCTQKKASLEKCPVVNIGWSYNAPLMWVTKGHIMTNGTVELLKEHAVHIAILICEIFKEWLFSFCSPQDQTSFT